MVDGSGPPTEEDFKIYHLVQGRKAILVVNKTDLTSYGSIEEIVAQFPGVVWTAISALYNQGIEALKATVFAAITDQRGPADLPTIVPNVRHKVAIQKAIIASKAAEEGLRTGRPPELVAIDLRGGLDFLGEIIGVTTTDDILDQIFNRFCIGK
jgi:tRNA modification GTPase